MPYTLHLVANETVSLAVDGLLLDCDGVLVDSHDAAAVAWNQWAKQWAPGFDFHRDVEHGRRISDLVAELISNSSDVDTAVAELTQRELDFATDVDEISGARQFLILPRRTLGCRDIGQSRPGYCAYGIGGTAVRGRAGHRRGRRERKTLP